MPTFPKTIRSNYNTTASFAVYAESPAALHNRAPVIFSGNAGVEATAEGLAWNNRSDNNKIEFRNSPFPVPTQSDWSVFLRCRIDSIEQWGAFFAFATSNEQKNVLLLQRVSSSSDLRVYFSNLDSVTFSGVVNKITDGKWHTLCVTRSGVVGFNCKFFIDGTEEANSSSGGLNETNVSSTDKLFVGGSRAGTAQALGDYQFLYVLPYEASAPEVSARSIGHMQWDWLRPIRQQVPVFLQATQPSTSAPVYLYHHRHRNRAA